LKHIIQSFEASNFNHGGGVARANRDAVINFDDRLLP